MKKVITITLFFFIWISAYAQDYSEREEAYLPRIQGDSIFMNMFKPKENGKAKDYNETERVYLSEIQADSAFLRMLDSVLSGESEEGYYSEDFGYGIDFSLDIYGNQYARVCPFGTRVPKFGTEFGIMDYKGYPFLFCFIQSLKDGGFIKITDKMVPFDFAVDQSRMLEDGTFELDSIYSGDDWYGFWLFRYENDEWILVRREESTVY